MHNNSGASAHTRHLDFFIIIIIVINVEIIIIITIGSILIILSLRFILVRVIILFVRQYSCRVQSSTADAIVNINVGPVSQTFPPLLVSQTAFHLNFPCNANSFCEIYLEYCTSGNK